MNYYFAAWYLMYCLPFAIILFNYIAVLVIRNNEKKNRR